MTQVSPQTDQFEEIIQQVSQKYGISPALVRAVMLAESSGNPRARSGAGAVGLMQLMPGTAREMGVRNRRSPEQSIEGGARYLSELINRFGNEDTALAAYNRGPTRVAREGVGDIGKTYIDRVRSLMQSQDKPGNIVDEITEKGYPPGRGVLEPDQGEEIKAWMPQEAPETPLQQPTGIGARNLPQIPQKPVQPPISMDGKVGVPQAPDPLEEAGQAGGPTGLLATLGQAFGGPDGTLRLMELLGGIGQSVLGARAQGKADKRTAQSQARANLVNSLSRRGTAYPVKYEARPGVGHTLMGTIAAAGKMGQGAIAQQRAVSQQQFENKRKLAEEERSQQQLGINERLATNQEKITEANAEETRQRQALEARKAELEAKRASETNAYQREMIDLQLRRIEATLEAARIRASASGGAANREAMAGQRAQAKLRVLRGLYDKMNKEGLWGKVRPGDNGVGSWYSGYRNIWPFSRSFPGAMTYQDVGGAIALSITVDTQGSRPSDTDASVVKQMIPTITDPPEVVEAKFAAMDELANFGKMLMAQGRVVGPGGIASMVRIGDNGVPIVDLSKAGQFLTDENEADLQVRYPGMKTQPQQEQQDQGQGNELPEIPNF